MGSFFFISLVELIPSGLGMQGNPKAKLIALFLGWAIMVMIAIWV